MSMLMKSTLAVSALALGAMGCYGELAGDESMAGGDIPEAFVVVADTGEIAFWEDPAETFEVQDKNTLFIQVDGAEHPIGEPLASIDGLTEGDEFALHSTEQAHPVGRIIIEELMHDAEMSVADDEMEPMSCIINDCDVFMRGQLYACGNDWGTIYHCYYTYWCSYYAKVECGWGS